MTEKELQQGIIDCAHAFGWRVAHFRSVPVKRGSSVRWETPVQADGKGFPDLVLVRDRIVWAEIKVGRNGLSDEQEAWIEALEHTGAEVYCWREKHWTEGEIDAILR